MAHEEVDAVDRKQLNPPRQEEHLEAMILEFVFPTHTKAQGTLFGGTLVAWMDKAAAYIAVRRARSPVVTASIESIDFQIPIKQGDMVELTARV